MATTTTTIQERLEKLCELTGLSPEKLSTAANLSRSFLRRIIDDPARKSIMSEPAEKLSYVTGVSRAWIVSGVGSMNESDVPKQPPRTERKQTSKREEAPEWIETAKHALELDQKLDWAIMGVGELPAGSEDLTAYALLAEAERFKKTCPTAARKRLDHKARAFRKEYCTPASRTTQPQRQSSFPPKGG
jgi:hypothetical protein